MKNFIKIIAIILMFISLMIQLWLSQTNMTVLILWIVILLKTIEPFIADEGK